MLHTRPQTRRPARALPRSAPAEARSEREGKLWLGTASRHHLN
jgi:hypothetical protein